MIPGVLAMYQSQSGPPWSLVQIVNMTLGLAGGVLTATTIYLQSERTAAVNTKGPTGAARAAARDLKAIDKSLDGVGKVSNKLGWIGVA